MGSSPAGSAAACSGVAVPGLSTAALSGVEAAGDSVLVDGLADGAQAQSSRVKARDETARFMVAPSFQTGKLYKKILFSCLYCRMLTARCQ